MTTAQLATAQLYDTIRRELYATGGGWRVRVSETWGGDLGDCVWLVSVESSLLPHGRATVHWHTPEDALAAFRTEVLSQFECEVAA